METFPFSLAAGAAAIALAFAPTARAEHGDEHNGCLKDQYYSINGFSTGPADPYILLRNETFMQQFRAASHGILIKEEAVVHYNILVDLDLKSLESQTVVLLRCTVWDSPNRQGNIGKNSRVIWGDQLNNKPTTVEIPVCVADVDDPRSAKSWRCHMNLLGSEEIAVQGGGMNEL